MNRKLKEAHEEQWEVFDVLTNFALDDLIEDEMTIRKKYGMVPGHLPTTAQNTIQRNRQAWLQEWGPRGRQVTDLQGTQQKQLDEAELDDRYNSFLDSEREKSQEEAAKDYNVVFTQINRNRHWHELKMEQEVISLEYNYGLKTAVPDATERRMAKEAASFKSHWDGEQPRQPLDQWATLDKQDLENEFQSWRDLMASHNIVERYYAVQGLPVPDSTKERQHAEIESFQKEIDAYKASAEKDAVISDKEAQRAAFKEQLESFRNRHQQGLRPKGPH